jgi:hypothetical protein
VVEMYKKRRKLDSLDIDDLDLYSDMVMEEKVEEGSLNAEDAGFLRGHNLGSIYSEEEEE